MTRRICVFTATRAEYGLLEPLMEAIRADGDLELKIIAAGMHLSPEFGLTYREIEAAGFIIDEKIEMLLSSDTACGVAKSMGLGLIGLGEALERLRPDIMVILGDRYEVLCAAAAALVAGVPIAHLHGGECTFGAVDESIRHAVTKMSHLHFTAAEVYRRRVIQMGEDPRRVFNVGALGLDNIARLTLLSREDLERDLQIRFAGRNVLVTYHPTTAEPEASEAGLTNLLDVLDGLNDTFVIFTHANADAGGRRINQMIDAWAAARPERARVFTSLGQLRYLSLLREADAVVGNSSSGIIEAPSLKTATINIGDRQAGRLRAASVIDCRPSRADIAAAFKKLYTAGFRATVETVANPHGGGDAARHIVEVLKHVDPAGCVKKRFNDVDIDLRRSA